MSARGDDKLWCNNDNVKVALQADNPKKPHTKAYASYEKYRTASTIAEAKAAGATNSDLKNDFDKGFLQLGQVDAELDKLKQLAVVKEGREKLSPERKKAKSVRVDEDDVVVVSPVQARDMTDEMESLQNMHDGFEELEVGTKGKFQRPSPYSSKGDTPVSSTSINLQQFGSLLDQKLQPL